MTGGPIRFYVPSDASVDPTEARNINMKVVIHRAVVVAAHLLVVGIEAHERYIADEAARLIVVKHLHELTIGG
jgi:hypothetical protein